MSFGGRGWPAAIEVRSPRQPVRRRGSRAFHSTQCEIGAPPCCLLLIRRLGGSVHLRSSQAEPSLCSESTMAAALGLGSPTGSSLEALWSSPPPPCYVTEGATRVFARLGHHHHHHHGLPRPYPHSAHKHTTPTPTAIPAYAQHAFASHSVARPPTLSGSNTECRGSRE